MATIDLSSIEFFIPLILFIVVFALIFGVLAKLKMFENKGLQVLIAFLLALVFSYAAGAQQYLQNVIPFFAVLLVCLFFILVLMGFIGKDMAFLNKGTGILFFAILIIGLVIAAFTVFSASTSYYWGRLSEPRWYGAIILLIVSAIVGFILLRAK